MIAVERNNHGAGVLAYLDSVERYARVYEQVGCCGVVDYGGVEAWDGEPDGGFAGGVALDVF